MPTITFKDIIQDWERGLISFFIVSAAVVVFYVFLVVIDQHHRMKPPKRKVFAAGCAFMVFMALWMCLASASHFIGMMMSVTKHFNQQVEDMRTAAIGRENRGLSAGVIGITPIKNVTSTNPNPNINFTTLQGVVDSVQKKTIESGTEFAVAIRIANAGPPTTAWNYRAYIILPGQDSKEIDAIIPGLLLEKAGDISTAFGRVKATKENFMIDALSSTPLATGAAGIYWMEIHINGIKEVPLGTHVVITFTDVFDRVTKVDYIWAQN
jgi:hypothetical protein